MSCTALISSAEHCGKPTLKISSATQATCVGYFAAAYACHTAPNCPAGSLGLYLSHPSICCDHCSVEVGTTLVAPVARTASSMACMPAVDQVRSFTPDPPPYSTFVTAPPLSKSGQGVRPTSAVASRNGSLKSSKITAGFTLNSLATAGQDAAG